MGKDNDSLSDLLPQLMKLFVSLLDLLVQGLVFNLQLFEINQMKTISQLLLLLQDLLLVRELVPESDVLKSVLMNFLILQGLTLFPLVPLLWRNHLSSPRENGIRSHTSLKLFELLLDFMALGLFLIKLGLELRGHLVVSILSFFKVDSYLMDVSQGVEVLMFVHLNIRLLAVVLLESWVHRDNALLKLLIFPSKLILFS